MDFRACNVIYVYRAANRDELVRQNNSPSAAVTSETSITSTKEPRNELLEHNLEKLLQIFSEGRSCVKKLLDLNRGSAVDLVPTVVLIDMPKEDQPHSMSWNERRPCSSSSSATVSANKQNESLHNDSKLNDIYGLELLQHIASEIEYRNLSSLTVPVAIIEAPNTCLRNARSKILVASQPNHNKCLPGISSGNLNQRSISISSIYQIQSMKSLDTGAVDVLISPLSEDRLSSLIIHAYRAHRNALKEHRALVERRRNRKGSWLGVDNQKPYAYLREAMVSGLMDGICQIGDHDPLPNPLRVSIVPNRRETISAALDSWDFSAHDFTDDELLFAALQMLQHILKMPELELWQLSTENLTVFLFASRSAYNAFVPYHNFRHVVDVLQACFVFLIRLGRIPPYSDSNIMISSSPSALAESIRPNDALTLLITAIGHDVGHPGVNNAFLASLNAPLTKLYNDRSVLETFHCAAYSQILRRYWPAAFRSAEMRQLMINSILATDMGLHFDYMKRLDGFQQNIPNDSMNVSKNWSSGERRALACSLLIKCADISNVARKYDIASKWTIILTDECARQATMEKDLGIPSALFAPPVREMTQLGESQIGFMKMFALPLFREVSKVMPAMSFCVQELYQNKSIWENKIAEHQITQKKENKARDEIKSLSESIKTKNTSGDSSQNLIIPTRYRSKKKHDLKPIDVSLSMANFQNLSPFSNVSNTNSSNISSSRQLSPPKSPLSQDGSGKQYFKFGEQDSPTLADSENFDTPFRDNERHDSNQMQMKSNPPRKISLNTLGTKRGRLSNVTEISGSVVDDWTSQTNSENQTRSPSTEGTSVTSDFEHSKDFVRSDLLHQELPSILDPDTEKDTDLFYNDIKIIEETDTCVKNVMVVHKVRVLKKKRSRFRLTFWKQNKRNSSSALVLHNNKFQSKVIKE